jgi:hypothetical protein
MLKIGDVMLRKGKEVRVIALTENGNAICRFIEDINGRHANRCYIYTPDQLVPKYAESLLPLFRVEVLKHGTVIGTSIPYIDYPSDEVIINQIKYFGGMDARVVRTLKLTYK